MVKITAIQYVEMILRPHRPWNNLSGVCFQLFRHAAEFHCLLETNCFCTHSDGVSTPPICAHFLQRKKLLVRLMSVIPFIWIQTVFISYFLRFGSSDWTDRSPCSSGGAIPNGDDRTRSGVCATSSKLSLTSIELGKIINRSPRSNHVNRLRPHQSTDNGSAWIQRRNAADWSDWIDVVVTPNFNWLTAPTWLIEMRVPFVFGHLELYLDPPWYL